MDLTDQLRCVFSGRVVEEDDSYLVEVPKREVELGGIEPNDIYRVGLFGAPTANETTETDSTPARAKSRSSSGRGNDDHGDSDHRKSDHTRREPQRRTRRREGPPEPPVENGETRTVEIEDIGDQGDGLARVERGFVVIVPETKQGERVRIEITSVQENVAFGDVVERLHAHE